MSKYVTLESWPTVSVNYQSSPSTAEVNEFFTIMDLCFQIAEKKSERFTWDLKLQKGTPSSPVFGIKFVGWLVRNKQNISQYVECTNVYLGDQSMKKWMTLIMGLYRPTRPVHVKEMFD